MLELVDILIKKRKTNWSVKLINYVKSRNINDFIIKSELLLILGKFFKNEKNIEKALLAFEECYFMANLKNDNKLKIRSIVSISSCYIEVSDFHKAILYYHKLIDLESFSQLPDDNLKIFIDFDLRIAVRQNLFTAHYKLGKLRQSLFYLSEIIRLIDENFNFEMNNFDSMLIRDSFAYVQIKLDASIELSKLYYNFREFLSMKSVLKKLLEFTEKVTLHEDIQVSLNEKQLNSLNFFKIKCFSLTGICLACLREFRNSKLSTKKAICLIDKEINKFNDQSITYNLDEKTTVTDNTIGFLNFLYKQKIEILINASEAFYQITKTFKDLRKFMGSYVLLNRNYNQYDTYELNVVNKAKHEMINFAKNAYFLSTKIVDPNLKIHATFNLAYFLYKSHSYQSSAYYFNQVLSVSTIILNSSLFKSESQFYIDQSPDYQLESLVYLIKSRLMLNFYECGSVIKSKEIQIETNPDLEKLNNNGSMEELESKLIKALEIILKKYFKWKLTETNRFSFLISLDEKKRLNEDQDSIHLKKIFKTCCECLVYISFNSNNYKECLLYMELYDLVMNSSVNDLIDLKLVNPHNHEFDFANFNYQLLKTYIVRLNTRFILRFKFIFESKILYIILVETENSSIIYVDKIKLTQQLNDFMINLIINSSLMSTSELNYINGIYEQIQNEWIKKHLNEFEYKNLSDQVSEIFEMRINNRSKENALFNHFIKGQLSESKHIYEYNFDCVDLLNLDFNKNISRIDLNLLEKKEIQIDSENIDRILEEIEYFFRKLIFPPNLEAKFEELKLKESTLILIDSKYAKLFQLIFNTEAKLESYLICFGSYICFSNYLQKSFEADKIDNQSLELIKTQLNNAPIRSKQALKNNYSIKMDKIDILPRYTSNPKLALNLINEQKNSEGLIQKNDHIERAKSKLDTSIVTLITETSSGTSAKRSNLEIIPFQQINKLEKCCVIGCPEIPTKFIKNNRFKLDKFQSRGLEQLCLISKILKTKAIFASKATKVEMMYQFSSSSIIFVSTFSHNKSKSVLMCSESEEYPSSFDEFDKYCLLSCEDLDQINMNKCKLLILNCYSTMKNVPRLKLVYKFLSRGCKTILTVLSPLSDTLMTQFYALFFENLKQNNCISNAYHRSISQLLHSNTSSRLLTNFIKSSFCLISAGNIYVNLNEIIKCMEQLNIEEMYDYFKTELNVDRLNPDPKISILSPKFMPSLEKALIELQILIKFLINQLVADFKLNHFGENFKFKELLLHLNEVILKGIIYITSNKANPDRLDKCIQENNDAMNLLKCLGYNMQRESLFNILDKKDTLVLLYPDNRFLDLNMRISHVISCLIEICYQQLEYSYRIKSVIYNLVALLPVDDRLLLKCLNDIISLTKFSPEIVLSLTDNSVKYAFSFYENINKNSLACFRNKDYFKWNYSKRDLKYYSKENSNYNIFNNINQSIKVNYLINNKVINFFTSIGYEIIGNWLHFNLSPINEFLLEFSLKFLTSFEYERDMSLYKEMKINVLGESAISRNFSKSESNLSFKQLKEKEDNIFDVRI